MRRRPSLPILSALVMGGFAASTASAQEPPAAEDGGTPAPEEAHDAADAQPELEGEEGPWRNELARFELGGILSLYTAAVEEGVDGESSRQLSNDLSFGLHAAATWRFWGPFSIGVYAQFETGNRELARFTGEVVDGVAQVERLGGGGFSEIWFGPLLRA